MRRSSISDDLDAFVTTSIKLAEGADLNLLPIAQVCLGRKLRRQASGPEACAPGEQPDCLLSHSAVRTMHKFASVCLCLPLSAFACSACLCLCLPQPASTCLRLPPPDFNIDFDLKFKQ